MRYNDQKKYFDALRLFEHKLTSLEQKEYKMFSKRHKAEEDLDNVSFNKLEALYKKYYVSREKPDLNDLFKKK